MLRKRNYAVVIGVDGAPEGSTLPPLRYAGNDATELAALLTDQRHGVFRPEDVDLLVGRDATASAIRRRLRHRVSTLRLEEFLFVFYAGTAFVPSWSRSGELFLATADTDLAELELEPDHALRSSFLRQDVFEGLAGRSLLMLDATLSASSQRSDVISLKPVAGDTTHTSVLHFADDAAAREREDLRHGDLTHLLLQGLRGEAAPGEAEVTVEDLLGWFARNGRNRVQVTNGRDTTTLARVRPAARRSPGHGPLPMHAGLSRLVPVSGPLDLARERIEAFVHQLVADLSRLEPAARNHRDRRLAILQQALEAKSVGVVRVDDAGAHVVGATDDRVLEEVRADLHEIGRAAILERRSRLAYMATTFTDRSLYVVPVAHEGKAAVEMLVALDPGKRFPTQVEATATLVKTFLTPSPELDTTRDGLALRLLSALKETYGRIPLDLYELALECYRKEMQACTIKFEPIVRLQNDGRVREIRSFEALARRHSSDRSAPGELLRLAQVWGDRFIIERDIIMMNAALRTYREFLDGLHFKGGVHPIGVNVAIASLVSQPYLERLREAIHRNHLEGSVTLEISEQDEIVLPAGMAPEPSAIQAFRRHLIRIAAELEVQFAIDDFGVGHSSLDRLSSLSLTQIKVDRAVLNHPCRFDELGLVVKIAQQTLLGGAPEKRGVILEGLDEEIMTSTEPPLTLEAIYQAGIRDIQGYILGDFGAEQSLDVEVLSRRTQRWWR